MGRLERQKKTLSNIAITGQSVCPEKTGKHKDAVFRGAKRLGAVAVMAFFLIWYCNHPGYYGEEETAGAKELFTSLRTYFVLGSSMALLALWLIPNRLSDRLNRILGVVWLAAAPFAVYFSLLYLNATKFHIRFFELNPIAVSFTFWFLFLLLGAFLLITGSIRISVMLLAILIAAIGIANCFVISFRGTAISGADLFSLKTAATVASGYEYETDWYIYAEVFLTFAICLVSCKIRRFRLLTWKHRLGALGAWLVLFGSFYHICCKTSFLEDHDIRSGGFTHQLRYKQYDMLFTTLCTCFYLSVDKPEGYSIGRVYEIADDYINAGDDAVGSGEDADKSTSDKSTSDKNNAAVKAVDGSAAPNLIVIMNESFADYTDIGNGLEFSEDYMPFIRSLTENTIKGTAYASIFGANTPNSEYEFLTGNTMGFLPETSVGFNLFVRGDMPSLASELKSEGYRTLAMHPYRGTNYRRNIVYPQIGFDKYYDRKYFISPDFIRRYVSDQTLMDRIITEFEKNLDRGVPFFCYNVKIQNHGGYTSSNAANLDDSIEVLTKGVDKVKVNQYANLVKATDDAFESLVTYFSNREEPVIIVMFGDHQPNLGDSTYRYLLGNEEKLTPEERMEQYKVPFIAWANYDIQEETIEKTSLNYLYSILADRLELPMTGYQKYLLELSEEIPVLASGGYWTADGAFYELDDRESPYYDRINDYNILEYNYIFGKTNRCLELFELQEGA